MSNPPSILIAVPGAGYVSTRAEMAFGAVVGGTVRYWMKRYGPDAQVAIRLTDRMATDKARCELSKIAIKNDFDWVLWLDDDMDPPPNIVEMLMRHDVPMASGCASKKCLPPEVMAYDFLLDLETGERRSHRLALPEWFGAIKTDGAGMACILMRTDVIRYVSEKLDGKPFQIPPRYGTEDMIFFETASAGGYRTIIDSECVVGHLGIKNFLPNAAAVADGHYLP